MKAVNLTQAVKPSVGCPVDGHVHFHNLALVAGTLDAAAGNFRALGSSAPDVLGSLLRTWVDPSGILFEGARFRRGL